MLQQIVEAAPFDGRIVMGGYCMEPETLYVFAAQNKRLNIQFAGGEERYSPWDGRWTREAWALAGSSCPNRVYGRRLDFSSPSRVAVPGTSAPESGIATLACCSNLVIAPLTNPVRLCGRAGVAATLGEGL